MVNSSTRSFEHWSAGSFTWSRLRYFTHPSVYSFFNPYLFRFIYYLKNKNFHHNYLLNYSNYSLNHHLRNYLTWPIANGNVSMFDCVADSITHNASVLAHVLLRNIYQSQLHSVEIKLFATSWWYDYMLVCVLLIHDFVVWTFNWTVSRTIGMRVKPPQPLEMRHGIT